VDVSTFEPPAPPVRPMDIKAVPPHPSGAWHPREVARLFSAYGLPMVAQEICENDAAALAAAERIGWPVALKAIDPAIVHKTEAGALALGLASGEELTAAMREMRARMPGLAEWLVQRMAHGDAELLLGVRTDPQFGPQLVVGAGGVLVELLHDVAVATVPMAASTAHKLLEQLKVAALLRGVRGKPALDASAVVDVMVRLSWLAHDLRDQLLELDINPLMVARSGVAIVDARVLCRQKTGSRLAPG
ncbi:MAG TPA: acetate--CoA ligase family protein, partial [Acetobacteraceae bacterium]|nr:acetate--CoA ligase family protein [Acetobacteraceae bacterium]